MTVRPVKPQWKILDKGAYAVERDGTIKFEMATALAERRYNWDEKVMIFLSTSELATLMAAPQSEHQFYHDTFKGQPGREGTLIKTFKWTPAPQGNAYFINASSEDKSAGTKYQASVSLSASEFYLLKKLIDHSFLYLLGWDAALLR
eukprot:GHRR01027965.1.p1 GENE.GHRR01027965.1~~GHRR01027965.1.p1  ORF type:complete len:147 (+),score=46.04 GHRR01027965.1:436-876(+)